MSQQDLRIAFLLSTAILLLPEPAFAHIPGDTGVTSAMSTLQDALPAVSLAVLGTWSVLQYTEAWDVDDGPLSGVIAWWRWKFWMPPAANHPRLSNVDPARVTQGYTHIPTVSYSNLTTCWIFLILTTTSIQRGIFWRTYGAFAAALFVLFIVSWRSVSKLVISASIPTSSQCARDAYSRAIAAPGIHSHKSRTLNALASLPIESVYGIMARNELRDAESVDVLEYLKSQALCAKCRGVVDQERQEQDSWELVLGLLEWHIGPGAGMTEECRVKRPFRWTRICSGGVKPLLIDDRNVAISIVHGGLGAWRFKRASFPQRLWKNILFLVILFPLCFSFQIILALLTLAIPVYRYYSNAQDGTIYYIPMNTVVPNGLYLSNGTLIHSLPNTRDYSTYLQWTTAIIFMTSGVLAFVVGCFEAWAAQRTDPCRVLSAGALRKISCGMMATYSVFVGGCLSFAAGYKKVNPWQTGLQYTLALLVSGILLGGSYVWRARNGAIGDTNSWVTPSFLQFNGVHIPHFNGSYVWLPWSNKRRSNTRLPQPVGIHTRLPAWFASPWPWRQYFQRLLRYPVGGLHVRMRRRRRHPVAP